MVIEMGEEKMLEKLINVKLAIARKKPKHEVEEKYMEYIKSYDLKQDTEEGLTLGDKIRHREIFWKYCEYMSRVEGTNGQSFKSKI